MSVQMDELSASICRRGENVFSLAGANFRLTQIAAAHEDHRRILVPIYNGGFSAKSAAFYEAEIGSSLPTMPEVAHLLLQLFGSSLSYCTIGLLNDYRQIYPGYSLFYSAVMRSQTTLGLDSALLLLGSSALPEQALRASAPCRQRVIFNGDFTARQAKLALVKNREATLGRHWHDYAELFFVIRGQATFHCVSVTKPGQETEQQLLETEKLLIPAHTAHMATVSPGTLLLGFTEQEYLSPEVNDHRWEAEI